MRRIGAKLIPILLSIIVVFGMVGCDGDTQNPGQSPSMQSTPSSSILPATPEPSIEPTAAPTPSTVPVAAPIDSTLEVHFIDVGQADSALILCDGRAMLIDGGNVADSDLLYSYLKNQGVTRLDYIVATHAHEDHVGGLAGALNYASADVALCPVTEYDSKAFRSFVKYLGDTPITVPSPGALFALGDASFEILGPTKPSDEPNNTSIVLKIMHGDVSILFTGDAERAEEQDILDAGYDLSATVLKVGHHGSDTSTTYPFLREIMPQYAVISVGTGNTYGHPTEAVLSRLRDADVTTYRTDMQGTVICTSNGKSVSFSTERNADVDTLDFATADGKYGQNTTTPKPNEPAPSKNEAPSVIPSPSPSPTSQVSEGTTYILNTNTYKFHYPFCSSVKQMKESNKLEYTGTRDEVISKGYDSCGRCKP